jgi:peptide-methionine (S)-S-oxide reductase
MAQEGREVITLGGGCFWCIEAVFAELKGVEKVESGYSGGYTDSPTYREVCAGTTGHAEVIQVTYDPQVITLKEILEVFFAVHDPTTKNRQGADIGTQYRSVIFYQNEEQKAVAEQVIAEVDASQEYPKPVVTELMPLRRFYKAEDYHQEYFQNNSQQPYCRVVVSPKLDKFRKHFKEKLK